MPSTSPAHQFDTVYLRNLHLSAIIGPDAWNRADKLQPIVLSLQLQIDTTTAGITDNIAKTFSYGQLCKDVTAKLNGQNFMSIDHFTSELAGLADNWPGETLNMQVLAPKALLRVEGGFGRHFFLRRVETKNSGWKNWNWHVGSHEWVVQGLKLACIIGVNPHERLEKQNLSIDLRILGEAEVVDYTQQIKGGFDTWRRLVKEICDVRLCWLVLQFSKVEVQVVEPSSFETLEALATLIAKTALEGFPVPQIVVNIEKPSALTFVDGAGVEIVRSKAPSLIVEPNAST